MGYIGKVPADVLIDPMVDSAAITDATIVTADLANDAVTAAKLAADSVDSSELVNGSVDNAHLAGSIAMNKTNLTAGTGLTLSTDTLSVDAAQTQITSVGTIGTGVWQGTKVASAYLDDDTAHLSGSTFTGAVQISHGTTPDFTLNDTGGTTNKRVFRISGGGDAVYFEGRNNDNSGDGSAGLIATMSLSDASTTFSGDIKNSSDSKSIYVGASNDLRILHDGSNSYIDHENTGDLKIRSRRHNGDIRFYNENSSGTETLTLQLTGASNANFAGDITINKGSALFNLQEPSGSQAYLYSGGSFTALRTTSSHPLHFSANYSSGDDALVLGTDGNVTVGAANVGKKVRVNTVTARHLDGLDDDTTWNTGNLYLNYDHDGDTFINVGGGKLSVGGTMSTYAAQIRGANETLAVVSSNATMAAMSLRHNSSSASSMGTVNSYWATKSSMLGSGTDTSPGLWATAGNNLHLGIGSAEKLTVTSAGYVTHSAQPAFHAYGMSAHVYANTNDADLIIFNNTDLNQGGHYSTSTGKFTAPVAGVYHFYFNAMYRHVGGDFHVTLRVNNSIYTISNNHQEFTSGTDLHDWVQTSTHFTIALSANDWVTCQMGSSENASTYLYASGRYCSFGGHLVA